MSSVFFPIVFIMMLYFPVPSFSDWDNWDLDVCSLPAMGFVPNGGNVSIREDDYRLIAFSVGLNLDTAVYKSRHFKYLTYRLSLVNYGLYGFGVDLDRDKDWDQWLDTVYLRVGPRFLMRFFKDHIYLGCQAGYGNLITAVHQRKNVHGFEGALTMSWRFRKDPFKNLDGGHETRNLYGFLTLLSPTIPLIIRFINR